MKSKKAQGLTLNTVVIAVLVLIVLAVLIFIVYKYVLGSGRQIGELTDCSAREGSLGCKAKGNCPDTHTAFWKMGGCKDDTPYCCISKDV